MFVGNVFVLHDTLDICSRGYYTESDRTIKLKLSEAEQRISEVLLLEDVQRICEKPNIEKRQIIGRIGHFCVNEDSFSIAGKSSTAIQKIKFLC